VLVAIVGPYVAPYGPSTPVGVPNALPGGKAVLGTDYLGQDVLSRLLYGGRSILIMALIATAAGLIVGVMIGLVAAYARNALDDVLMRAMDVIMAFPQIMLALVAVAVIGPAAWVIVVAIALTTVPRIARVARGAALPVVERDFIASPRLWGCRSSGSCSSTCCRTRRGRSWSRPASDDVLHRGHSRARFLGLAPDPNGANWG
jgi:peptide/nickel transport system permease protein